MNTGVHIVPKNDLREHRLEYTCWCNPDVRWIDPDTGEIWAAGRPMVVHDAADGRLKFEAANGGKSIAPDRGWVEHDINPLELEIEDNDQGEEWKRG